MLVEMQPECTFVQMPPDLPMFIKPQNQDFRSELYQFVRYARDANFFVNPLPQYASDIQMTKVRVEQLINQTFRSSPELFGFGRSVAKELGNDSLLGAGAWCFSHPGLALVGLAAGSAHYHIGSGLCHGWFCSGTKGRSTIEAK